MMPPLFKCRLLRPCTFGGRLHPAGELVSLPAEVVHQLLHLRRVVLVDRADAGVLLDHGKPWATR